MSTEITLRPGRPDDAARAAELIMLIGPEMINYIFHESGQRTQAMMQRLFAWPTNEFSYEDTTLAIVDGQIAGLVQSADRRRRTQNLWAIVPRYVQVMGLGASPRRLPRLARLTDLDRDIGKHALYIKHLGTAPEFKRRGVATALLESCADKARDAGMSALHLDVDRSNDPGLQLYQRRGFQIIDEVHSKRLEAEIGFSGYFRMERPLA